MFYYPDIPRWADNRTASAPPNGAVGPLTVMAPPLSVHPRQIMVCQEVSPRGSGYVIQCARRGTPYNSFVPDAPAEASQFTRRTSRRSAPHGSGRSRVDRQKRARARSGPRATTAECAQDTRLGAAAEPRARARYRPRLSETRAMAASLRPWRDQNRAHGSFVGDHRHPCATALHGSFLRPCLARAERAWQAGAPPPHGPWSHHSAPHFLSGVGGFSACRLHRVQKLHRPHQGPTHCRCGRTPRA